MPGFPLAAIGAGLGQWAKLQQEQQAQRERQQMLQLTLQRFQQEQQDRQNQQQAASGEWNMLANGGAGIAPVSPVGGGGFPGSRTISPAMAFDAAQPPQRPPLSPGVGGAVRNQGDAWLQQNAPFPTQRRQGPQPEMDPKNLPWRTEPAPQSAYDEVSGPGAPVGGPSPPPASTENMPPPRPGPNAPPDAMIPQARAQLAQTIPPAASGRMSATALAQQIDRAMPGATPEAKLKVLKDEQARLAPIERERFQEVMQQNRQIFSEQMADRRAGRAEDAADKRSQRQIDMEERREKAKWGDPMPMVDPQTKQTTYVQVNKGTGEVRPVKGLTGEVTKMGTRPTNASPLEDSDATFWAQVLAQGGSLPAGLRRSGVVEQVMKKVPGTAQGMTPGDFIAKHSGVQADTGSLRNMTKMSDAAISFEKLAEKNFDVALKLAPDAVPTELGPFFNQWIERGETLLGDPNVPPYVAAMLTGANEYAKVMSGSTGTAASTNDSRRQAAEMFSPYFSLPQISQVIAVAKADMKNRENSLTEQTNLIKQRLGSSVPVEIAPPATPKKTGQESQTPKQPTPEHVTLLKSDPTFERRKQFDEVYGVGAAARAFGFGQ